VNDIEDDLAVLEELRDERLAQYYTILQHIAENEGVEVAGRILDQIDAGQEVDKALIGKLARVMQVSSQSMDNLIARIQSLTNDIADRRGESPRTERRELDVDADAMQELSESISDAYGDA
jgi:L-arabinose isomerase